MKSATLRGTDEKTLSAFAYWLGGNLGTVFTEQSSDACVSGIREFADFIAPRRLVDSTCADWKEFERSLSNHCRSSAREAVG
jgi:hypothetical protein